MRVPGGTLVKLVPEANVEVTTRHVQTDAFLGVGYGGPRATPRSWDGRAARAGARSSRTA